MIIKKLLGEILMDMGFINNRQLGQALRKQMKLIEGRILPEHLERAKLISEARLASGQKSSLPLGKIITDMGFTTKEQLQSALNEQNKIDNLYRSLESEKLGTAIEVSSIIASSLNIDEVLALIMKHVNRVTQSVASTLMLLDEHTGELVFSVPTGPKADQLTDIRIPPGTGIAGWVAEHGQSLLVPDIKKDPRFYPEIDRISGFKTKSILCVPLKFKNKLIGVLEVINKTDGSAFTEKDALLLGIFAGQSAMAIENARLYGELKNQMDEILVETEERRRAEEALRGSEERYRNIFQNAFVSLWEADYSEVKAAIDQLQAQGVKDFRKYLAEHPEFVQEAVQMVKVLDVNEATLRLYGAERKEELLGSSLTKVLLPESLPIFTEYLIAMAEGKRFLQGETAERTLQGERLDLLVNITFPSEKEKFNSVLVSIMDITRRKQAEELTKTALQEKEVLLKEIHHRVKNNMQIISSLLKLQMRNIKSKKLEKVFQESQDRIRVMALVHELLYRSRTLAGINLKIYISDLTKNLFHSYRPRSKKISLRIDSDQIILGIDQAIPCGLVITEIISNSLKHAFTAAQKGEIWIEAHLVDSEEIELIVGDNGKGMPKSIDYRISKTLGLELVTGLVESQLGGSLKMSRVSGTQFTIRFRIEHAKSENNNC
ncbi:hypothetical protein ES703_56567 [subsurface metagenome]